MVDNLDITLDQSLHRFAEMLLGSVSTVKRCVVAFSGGLDSAVLLHIAQRVLPVYGFSVSALHINHGLSLCSDQWQSHCESVCLDLNVECLSVSVAVAAKSNLEASARDARYYAFSSNLNDDDVLLLAHHQQDQVETVLYRLLRGSGVEGLSGIPYSRPLTLVSGKDVQLYRPLLLDNQSALRLYANQMQLTWVNDESNDDVSLDRNYIRHQVLPLLASRWTSYEKNIERSAMLCGEAAELNANQAGKDALNGGGALSSFSLPIMSLSCLSEPRQSNLLYYWFAAHQINVSRQNIIQVLSEVVAAKPDAQPVLELGDYVVRRYQGCLLLGRCDDVGTVLFDDVSWCERVPLVLPGLGKLAIDLGTKGLAGVPLLDEKWLSLEFEWLVGFRRGGERCRPAGRSGSRSLKKLFQEFGVPPWLRDSTPLLWIDGRLALVPGYWVCEGFQAVGERGVVVRLSC